MHTRRSAKEVALFNKLDRLPVSLRRTFQLRQFDFSNTRVLYWLHSVKRGGRRYSMHCDVREGVLNVSYQSIKDIGKAFPMPKAKHFRGQLGN